MINGKCRISTHESADGLGVIIDKYMKIDTHLDGVLKKGKEWELTDTRTIWYADLEG